MHCVTLRRGSAAALFAGVLLTAAEASAGPETATAADPLDVILSLARHERASANEVAALGDVRAFLSAQLAYQAATGSYGDLTCLVRPRDCQAGAGAQPFLASDGASPQRNGYRRRLQLGTPARARGAKGASSFAYLSVPERPGETGLHGFCADDSGRICCSKDGSEPALAGGRCASSCPEWDAQTRSAAGPKHTPIELRAALEAIDEDPRLTTQPERVKEAWRALVHAALASQPDGELSQGRAHEGTAGALAFTPDGRTLVTSTMDRSSAPIKLWSVADGRRSGALTGDCPGVWALRVSPDGASVVASCMGGTVRRWSLADRKLVATLATHESSMVDLGISADGRLLASGAASLGGPGTAQLTTLPAGRPLATIRLPDGASRVALSPDGRTLVSAGFGAPVQLWSVPDGRLAATLGRTPDASALAISPDSRVLALAAGPAITLWSLPERRQIGSIAGHAFAVNQLAFCPDGRLVSASSDHSIKLWSVPEGRLLTTLRGHRDEVFGLAVSADGKLAASADKSGVVVLWDLETQAQRRVFVDSGR